MPPQQTGKHRASRIPLDYYKHGDRMVRGKRWLAGGLLAGAIVWISSLFAVGDNSPLGLKRFSHGPVALAHAPIEQDCSACHLDFAFFGSRLDPKECVGMSTFAGDAKCLQCHLGEQTDSGWKGTLAVHHDNQLAGMTPNCGSCHSDHHGRGFDIKRAADADCTVCHENLQQSVAAGTKLSYENVVTAFADDHPKFKLFRTGEPRDPGKLKFNHKYHMTPGIVLTPGGKPFKVSDMAPDSEMKKELLRRGLKESDPVRLGVDNCAVCHKPEEGTVVSKNITADPSADRGQWEQQARKYYERKMAVRDRLPTGELAPLHKPGAYMAPIKYDNHCAACHPLTFDPQINQAVKHEQQPAQLEAELTSIYVRAVAENAERFTARPTPRFPLPGKALNGAAAPSKDALVRIKVQQAMRTLLEGKRTCGECHVAKDGSALTAATQEIAKPAIPNLWYEHAKFDHAAHSARNMDCSQCHADAYSTTEQDLLAAYALPRKGAERVLVPGIANCRECHTPDPAREMVQRNWAAKHDCAECHNYHHGKR